MRVHLKGINSHTAKLADGTMRTYWYAWKGGPRLQGEPGTPEFIASYNEAAAQKIKTPAGRLLSLLSHMRRAKISASSRPRTRDDYKRIIQHQIEPEFSDFPLSGLTDRARAEFLWNGATNLRSSRGARLTMHGPSLRVFFRGQKIAARSPPIRANGGPHL